MASLVWRCSQVTLRLDLRASASYKKIFPSLAFASTSDWCPFDQFKSHTICHGLDSSPTMGSPVRAVGHFTNISVLGLLISTFISGAMPSTSSIRMSSTESTITCRHLSSSNKVRLTRKHCEAAFSAFLDSLPPRVATQFTRDHDSNKGWADGFVICPNSTINSGCNITFDLSPPDGDRPVQLPEIGFAALSLIEQCVETNGSDGGSVTFYSEEKPVQLSIGHVTSDERGLETAGGGSVSAATVSSISSLTVAAPPQEVTRGSGPYAKCGGFVCVT